MTPQNANADWISLLARIFDELPALPGAACAGRPDLFDPADTRETAESVASRYRAAAAVCASCPALTQCRAWADSLNRHRRPAGVVGGRIPDPGPPAGRRPTRETFSGSTVKSPAADEGAVA
ncbi:WhiB family transcriptional regulator [Williamsia herbipolensis]|uniref:WhiB family transcriptional regulator n=1 Tax=Williamsia herbipolensis TaxID=1603258 RepID=A0AAU4JYB8_9NOCA|nr:WhiB family transcriptional regulator [Williamsia herbipolensis]